MAWVILFCAGLFETGWAIGLKYTEGFTRLWPTVWTIVAMAISLWLLGIALAGMALWLRANRVAVDLQEWCDCAGTTVAVRVIESRRPAVADGMDHRQPVPAWADAERELATR